MRDIIGVLQFFMVMLWPMTALAASDSLGRAFTQHTLSDWLALLALSTVSGLVALLHRIRKNLEAEILSSGGKPFAECDLIILGWKVFAAFHMVGSYMAGFIGFFLGGHFGMDPYLHALTIAFFAWMGASLLDKIAGDGSGWALNLVAAAFNRSNGASRRDE